jgi:hypothetical protein
VLNDITWVIVMTVALTLVGIPPPSVHDVSYIYTSGTLHSPTEIFSQHCDYPVVLVVRSLTTDPGSFCLLQCLRKLAKIDGDMRLSVYDLKHLRPLNAINSSWETSRINS